MFRKLGLLTIVVAVVLPSWAADRPGSIAGYVRNSAGVPQMGAMVEVLGSTIHNLKVFTDENGFYSAAGLVPGSYSLKVSAPSFLPTLREKIGLRAGAAMAVDVTLSTLFEAMQVAPAGNTPDNDDDWKWVLRSVANRPVLRVFDDSQVAAKEDGDDRTVKGTVSFVAGSPSEGYGSASDMSTGFSVEKSRFASGTVSLDGNVGYGNGSPAAVVRAGYVRKMANGSEPQVGFTMRRLSSPDASLHNADLQALALTTSDNLIVGDILEFHFGSELQTIQFMGRVNAFRPFGSADFHLSPDTLIEYSYATSQPNTRMDKGFDSAPADLSESGPHVSLAGFSPAVEKAQHHELSVSQRLGKNKVQVAVYSDRMTDPALVGVGNVSAASGEVLPDIYSGTFTYQGSDFDTRGMRVVLQRKLASDLTATLDYSYGGVLDLAKPDVTLQDARDHLVTRDRHSVALKVNGTVPTTKTKWIASYRWMSGEGLTPVDSFNASPGQADPFLNLFVRQPIPGSAFLSAHLDALVDVRNLLAQGYVPVMGQDGHTLYLVQTARSLRGGVAISF